MTLKLSVFSVFILISSLTSAAQVDSIDRAINYNTLKNHVAFLSADKLQGRLTGTSGEKYAAQYVASEFKRLGLTPVGDNGTYYQCFALIKQGSPTKPQYGCNVLAKLQLSDKKAAALIIGAHLDHLGHGELMGSRARNHEKGKIHPGADDNASGVASLLALAAQLGALKKQGLFHGNKDIIFAAWSGEELGLLGSSYFIKKIMKQTHSKTLGAMVDAYINLDMIGRLNKKLVLQGIGSSQQWQSLVQRVNLKHPLSVIMQQDPYLPTDATAFYLRGSPILNLFTGAHDDYHTPRDTAERLNIVGMQQIIAWLLDFVVIITKEPRLDYQLVAKMHQPKRGFKIYLGTIPDYVETQQKGVKLSGVTHGSPAERAGVMQDDVIVTLAGKSIHDIDDYMFALNSLTAGQPVTMVVQRAQEHVALTLVAEKRA